MGCPQLRAGRFGRWWGLSQPLFLVPSVPSAVSGSADGDGIEVQGLLRSGCKPRTALPALQLSPHEDKSGGVAGDSNTQPHLPCQLWRDTDVGKGELLLGMVLELIHQAVCVSYLFCLLYGRWAGCFFSLSLSVL